MAHKPTTFAVDTKKKSITIYTNVEAVEAEQTLINYYLGMGFAPKMGEKKESKSIDAMRKELAVDAETLKKFNTAYSEKTTGKVDFKETGFAKACKIYNEWKKAQKK